MYILIDRAQMRVIAKHKDKTLLASETPEGSASILINEDDPETLNPFTDYELRVFYRGLGTVSNIGTLNRVTLIAAVLKLVHYLPMTTLPRQSECLFNDSGALPGTTSNDRPQANTSATAAKGGVRGTIWSVADLMWEAAGRPTDKGLVLALRKQIMGVLETENGVKRNSASNELGNWQKARIILA